MTSRQTATAITMSYKDEAQGGFSLLLARAARMLRQQLISLCGPAHCKKSGNIMFPDFSEAPTRFELVIEVLQTFALPLGYGAILYNMMELPDK